MTGTFKRFGFIFILPVKLKSVIVGIFSRLYSGIFT